MTTAHNQKAERRSGVERKERGILALVAIALTAMAVWAIALGTDRIQTYSAARKQSEVFTPRVAAALRDGKVDEAIAIADRSKPSHLAKVMNAGIQEFSARQRDGAVVDAAQRAMERARAIEYLELKGGVPALSLIAVVAPLTGLIGTLLLLVDALLGFAASVPADPRALAQGAGRGLIPLAAGLAIAILAYWLYHHLGTSLETLDVEMRNSGSELLDYFVRRAGGQRELK